MEIDYNIRKSTHLAIYGMHFSVPFVPEKNLGFWERIWWLLRPTWDDFHATVIHEHLDANEVGGVLDKDKVTRGEEEICDHVETLGGTGCCNQVIAEDEGNEETKERRKTSFQYSEMPRPQSLHMNHHISLKPRPPFPLWRRSGFETNPT